jgi:hypothetical protein
LSERTFATRLGTSRYVPSSVRYASGFCSTTQSRPVSWIISALVITLSGSTLRNPPSPPPEKYMRPSGMLR